MNITRYQINYFIRGSQRNYSIVGFHGMKKFELLDIFRETLDKKELKIKDGTIYKDKNIVGFYEIAKMG